MFLSIWTDMIGHQCVSCAYETALKAPSTAIAVGMTTWCCSLWLSTLAIATLLNIPASVGPCVGLCVNSGPSWGVD